MMNKVIYIIIFLILPICLIAQFEGEIQMKTFNANLNENSTINWTVKNGQHAMEFSSEYEEYKMDFTLLLNDKEVWMLSQNEDKKAYQIDINSLNKKNLNLPLNSPLKNKEEKKEIAGVECTLYQMISSDKIITCWISDNTGLTHSDFPSFMQNGELMSLLRVNGIQGIPLSFEIKDVNGELINGQWIEEINQKSINDKVFEIPSDYEKIETK